MAGSANPTMTLAASQPVTGSPPQGVFGIGGGKGGATGAATAAPTAPAAPTTPGIGPAAPMQITNPVGGNVNQTSANLYNQAASGPNIGRFMNPYTQSVIGTTMADLNRSRMMAMNDLGAQATAAGAFGGSRHGVAEAETNRGFMDVAAKTAAGLHSQGFDNALAAAERQQGMQSQLSQQGFGYSQAINQQQMQQGAMQQALAQTLIDAAKGQYDGFTGAPMQSLQTMLASVGAANMGQQTQTTTKKPGLFDYLMLPFMAARMGQ